jgi:hypothetical protein
MSEAKVIGVFGLSGVGKTRLIKAATEGLDGVLHVQASTLIKQGLADVGVTSEACAGPRAIACSRTSRSC